MSITKKITLYILMAIMALCAFFGVMGLVSPTAHADQGTFGVVTAQARVDRSGIRFLTEMDEAHYNLAKTNGYGFYIFPHSYLAKLDNYSDIEKDVTTKISIVGDQSKLFAAANRTEYKGSADYVTYATLINIKAVNFNKEFTCVPYVIAENGSKIYAVDETLSVSLQQVVSDAYLSGVLEDGMQETLMTTYKDGIVNGLPVADDIVKGFGTETFPILYDDVVKYDLSTKQFDIESLDFSSVDAVKIADVKTEINGEMPDMNLQNYTTAATSQHSADDVLRLTIGDSYLQTTKLATDKDFAGVTFKFYLNDGTVYELTNVKLYSKIIKDANDLESVFGEDYAINRDGYYVLGANVDADGIKLFGINKHLSNFFGIFDGMGYTISNANVSGAHLGDVYGWTCGSFFGNLQGHATVRNVAFVNLKTGPQGAVIAGYAGNNQDLQGGWTDPAISNVYVSVSSDSYQFFGLFRYCGAIVSNVIVEYPKEEREEIFGSFIGSESSATQRFTDCYVISKTYCTTINQGGTLVERTYEGLTRYENYAAMKLANGNYSSFSSNYWDVENGVPMWKNAPEIEIVGSDNVARTYDLSTKELDLSGLNFTLADVKTVEIAGVKTDITNGVMPDMNLQNYTTAATSQHSANDVLRLTIGDSYLQTTKLATDKDFAGVTFKFYLNDGTVYELTNVKLYSKIIKDANDLESVFGEDYAINRDGYYVLGANVDADGIKLFGINKHLSNFFGIFDGMGYTISNANVSGAHLGDVYGWTCGSFFGNLQGHATVRNVAFVNLKTGPQGAVIAGYAGNNQDLQGGWTNPAISNVYVSVSSDSYQFFGLFRYCGAIVSNVIVEYPKEEREEIFGSFIGSESSATQRFTDCYVISKTYCTTINQGGTLVERTYEGLTRYDSVDLMKQANNNYSTFNINYWTITEGEIPVWKNLPTA